MYIPEVFHGFLEESLVVGVLGVSIAPPHVVHVVLHHA